MNSILVAFGSLLSAPFVLCVLLGLPAMADDREKLLGDWRLVSFYTEDVETKQRNDVYGEHPIGHAALTAAGRLFAVITANGRKPPNGLEEQAAAFRSMIAYTGKFRVESEKFITQVDTAWNEAWVGAEQVRVWRVEGDKLHITSAPIPNPNVPGGKVIGVLVWERE
jgi:Lipocalin-like domain